MLRGLPPFKLDRVAGSESSCYDIDITVDFSTLNNSICRFMDVGIKDFVKPRYQAQDRGDSLILELLTDEYREELYAQGVKSLLVTAYIESDGSTPSITITTLDGEKIDPSRYQPLKNRWSPMMINGVPHRTIAYGRYNINGKNIALKVLYDVSTFHNNCYGECENSWGCYGSNYNYRHLPASFGVYIPFEHISYDYMLK